MLTSRTSNNDFSYENDTIKTNKIVIIDSLILFY